MKMKKGWLIITLNCWRFIAFLAPCFDTQLLLPKVKVKRKKIGNPLQVHPYKGNYIIHASTAISQIKRSNEDSDKLILMMLNSKLD